MLKPDDLVVLTEALQPPPGFELDLCVTTTYSMDLNAMLLTPMVFALRGDTLSTERDVIALLDATQRNINRTTVFTQAGGIHVPTNFNPLFTFLEDSIHEVTAPGDNAVFHPKIWAVRYCKEEQFHHRFLVTSRNLTLDNARDTLLVLDESPTGKIDPGPAVEFLSRLPEWSVEKLSGKKQEDLERLLSTFSQVMLDVPQPFETGRLLALMGETTSEGLFQETGEMVAISPFLSRDMLDRIGGEVREKKLLSRPEELDRLGSTALEGWDSFVLVEEPEQRDNNQEFSGLHAKTTVFDRHDGTSVTVTGSANLTNAGWGRNIEFNAVLTGPTQNCGTEAILGDSGGLMGLASIMESYSPETVEGVSAGSRDIEFNISKFHRLLALTKPHQDLVEKDNGEVLVRLTLDIPDDAPGNSEVFLLTVPGMKHDLAPELSWTIDKSNITRFVAVRTLVAHEDKFITRSCCLLTSLSNNFPGRNQLALSQLITNAEDEFRYLMLLLGTGSRPSAFERQMLVRPQRDDPPSARQKNLPPPVLFEPLMKAITQDPIYLKRVSERVEQLREVSESGEFEGSIFKDFGQMWDVVRDFLETEEDS